MSDTARLEKKVDRLLKLMQPRPMWVRASVITSLTGWTNQKMRQARENGYIEYKEEDGLWYNLTSLNEKFLKV